MKASDLFVKVLENEGVEFIFGIPGEENLDFLDFLGNTALSANDFVRRAVEAADLIINVGHDVVEQPPFFMRAGGVKVIHVNFSSASVDPVYFPQVEVVGDIANSIWRFSEELEPQSHWAFFAIHVSSQRLAV